VFRKSLTNPKTPKPHMTLLIINFKMKNEVTFEIEKKNLKDLFSERKFELAEQVATRMLTDYNRYD
jgi:hypothetical protein